MSQLEYDGLYGSDRPESSQREALRGGAIPVAVYGLGKMGLPLAAVYAEVTGNVTGVDVDESVVASVNRGGCHVQREPGLPSLVEDVVELGALEATTDAGDAAAASSVHVIIVPTLIDEDDEPDLSNLLDAVESVAAGLAPGDLVIVESTVPPRTCEDVVEPALAAESGLDAADFGVAFCPERTSSGRSLRDIRQSYPKVVGGIDEESTRVAELIYGEITNNDVIPAPDATTAEAVKVFEGVYRDVNIALANQLALYADELGIDVTKAGEIANTQPYCDIHTPGVGVGGHCIPYYPRFLTGEFETDAPLLRTAREVNDAMPGFAVAKLAEELAATGTELDDASVLVLGVTYRPGVEETRASPALDVVSELDRQGADVFVSDPMLDEMDWLDATPVPLDDVADLDLDGVVLCTAHEEFDDIDWTAHDQLVIVDGRQAIDAGGTDHRIYTIGGG